MDAITESRKFDANLDSLEPIRDFLADSAKKIGLNKSKIYKLCLAVDEIATNIINYGYLNVGITDGTIDVSVTSDDEVLTVILEDTATPFNPFKNRLPDENDLAVPLEERAIGGLGIMLAKENVDQFIYNFEDGKNKNIFCIDLSPDNNEHNA